MLSSILIASSLLLSAVRADLDYPDPPNAFPGYKMVWSDEFNGPEIDSAKWTPDWDCTGWGNNARQAFTSSPNNVNITDGMLTITPIFGNLTNDPLQCAPGTGLPPCACAKDNYMPIQATSAQISSAYKFQYKYGKTRMRARMAQGYYTWTAFWLHPANPGAEWPRDGETDVMESVGKWPVWWSAVAHYEQNDGKKKAKARHYDTNYDFGAEYHVFGLDWDDKILRWTVDEKEMFKVLVHSLALTNQQWDHREIETKLNGFNPYDKNPFYFIIDVAVGGKMFGDGNKLPLFSRTWPDYEEVGRNASQWRSATVDWIRVYQPENATDFKIGNGNASEILPGSLGARCPFGGCVGQGWDEWVKDVEASKPVVPTPPSGVSKTVVSLMLLIASLFITL